MACRQASGGVEMMRGAVPGERYVGKCRDCGWRSEPTSITSACVLLDTHFGKKEG